MSESNELRMAREAMRTGPQLARLYPELAAGGFTRVDGTVAFYVRVHALLAELGPDSLVVDFGAGRGAYLDDPVAYRRDLRVLRGRAGQVCGLDVDDSVLLNQALDERQVIQVGKPLPIATGAADLIIADHVFEHVRDPRWVSQELDRILRPDGWLCLRTPNRWGYIGIGARIVPNRLHTRVLRRLQPEKQPEDTFPTAYHLNTPGQLRQWFPVHRYDHIVWANDSEPAYAGRSVIAATAMRLMSIATPPPLRETLFAFIRKLAVGDGPLS